MKLWHQFQAWILTRRIRHQHRELAKYVRRSAYEINAWKQDIAFLEEQLDHHRSFVDWTPLSNPDKVVPMEPGDSAEGSRPDSPTRVFPDFSLSVATEGASRRGSLD